MTKPQGLRSNRHVMLFVLTLVFMSSYLDRQIVAVLLPQIKSEFSLSDSELGLLSGFAFALFYVTAGLPIARIADKSSRVNVLAICVAAWSACTAACAAATNFVGLLLARIGVGVGEAGCNPSAASLIAEHYPLESRATANAFYSVAVPVASLIALAGGGLVAEHMGWRTAFILVGAPGLLLAIAVKLLIADSPQPQATPNSAQLNFGDCLAYFARTPSAAFMAFAAAAESFAGFGIMMWLPTYFMRAYNYSIAEIGLMLGIATGALGFVGILTAGFVADRLGRMNRRWNCLLPASVMTIVFVFAVAAFAVNSAVLTMALLVIPLFTLGSSAGPINAAVQTVVPARMRATAAAVFGLILNLIGYGLGPTSIGALSDVFGGADDTNALKLALIVVCGGYAIAAGLYFLASRFLVNDIARAVSFDDASAESGQPLSAEAPA
ncbi:spinster family MFS transporter [Hyphomonas sp.]|uniref:spinster family MFS transporter n=1 Tax=Hyphomonas sp. TaxID=87 RepID=UPI0035284A5A